MSTEQLRNLLIDKIATVEDAALLRAIKTILDIKSASSAVHLPSEAARKKIRTGLEQLDKGQTISNEAPEQNDRWLQSK